MQDSAISATVDFHQDGVQHGFLKLPYSHDQSAWGNVMIPVTVIGNGEGPTACLLYTSPSPRDRQKSRMPSSA